MQAVAAETSSHHHPLSPSDPNYQAKVLTAITPDWTSAILNILMTKLEEAEVPGEYLPLAERQLSFLGAPAPLGRRSAVHGHAPMIALWLAVGEPRCLVLVLRASQ